ncbi:hypothetical protein GINT2_000439 [Glugoides intestinalis]
MIFPSCLIDYELDSVIGDDFKKVKLSNIGSEYIVLIFYPLDFTFVCPTEIIKFSEMYDEFRKLDVTILFCSCDSKYSHMAWKKTKREDGGIGPINWPMISDINRQLCTQFNLFNPETGTVIRSTVILDKSLNTLHISANIDPIGRSTKEVLRLIKAFYHRTEHGNLCFVDFDDE